MGFVLSTNDLNFNLVTLQYIVLFAIVVVLEIIVAISAYIMTHRVDDMLTIRMNNAFAQYRYDPDVRHSINDMQRTVTIVSLPPNDIIFPPDFHHFHFCIMTSAICLCIERSTCCMKLGIFIKIYFKSSIDNLLILSDTQGRIKGDSSGPPLIRGTHF